MEHPPARPRRDGDAPTTTSPRISRCCTAAESVAEIEDVVGGFFTEVDDDTPERLGVVAVA